MLSKWYLKDYPVRTWKYGDGIMVYGCDKDSIMRINGTYSLRILESRTIQCCMYHSDQSGVDSDPRAPVRIPVFRALKPITDGIESLSRE